MSLINVSSDFSIAKESLKRSRLITLTDLIEADYYNQESLKKLRYHSVGREIAAAATRKISLMNSPQNSARNCCTEQPHSTDDPAVNGGFCTWLPQDDLWTDHRL